MLQKLMQFFRCPLTQRAFPAEKACVHETRKSSSVKGADVSKDEVVVSCSRETNGGALGDSPSACPDRTERAQPADEELGTCVAQRFRNTQVITTADTIVRRHYQQLMKAGAAGIHEEFISLKDSGASYEVARQQQNAPKNRYCNVLPFDFNRVRMDEDERYINASLLESRGGEEPAWAYVAAQGPLPSTTPDFWQMIFENKVPAVVMLTRVVENNHTKCADYFPKNIGETAVYGNFEITPTESKQIGLDICQRTIKVKRLDTKKEHIMKHFNYQVWPDHGVPDSVDAILELSLSLQQQLAQTSGSKGNNMYSNVTVVHCSAGIGRTGAFISIDIILRRIAALERSKHMPTEQKIQECTNVLAVVQDLRHQRKGMVQTLEQYDLIYRALLIQFETILDNA